MVFNLSPSSRVITLLSSDSKIKRKESLSAIESDISDNLSRSTDTEVKEYCNWIIPHLVQLLSDPVESHRERTLGILNKICGCVEDSSCFIPSVTDVFVKRFDIEESYEESEEIRLSSLKLLSEIVSKTQTVSTSFNDCCFILQKGLEDSFQDVKVLSCHILGLLAKKFPSLFYHTNEALLYSLLRNIVHQQHKVRLATVVAIGVVFEHCNGKFVDLTIAPLTQRLFDPSISVRKAVIQITGEWLLNLSDRYSYQTKLIPLILSGQIDESNEIREEALALWHDIGLKFKGENENDLKDKIDFDSGKPIHYPPDQIRPDLGCRELISRSASRLLPGLCNDLRDWQEDTRHKAAGLLPILLLHLETAVTQHTQTLISGLCSGIAESLIRISPNSSLHLILMSPQRGLPNLAELFTQSKSQTSNARNTMALSKESAEAFNILCQLYAAGRYVSCFVRPQIWWKLMEENSRRCFESTSPASLAANYFLLANLLAGASLESLIGLPEDAEKDSLCPLARITAYLTSEDQVSCVAFASKAGLLECANALIAILEEIISKTKKSADDSMECNLKQVVEKVLEDTFFLLMSISTGWKEDLERTEFAVEYNDQVGRMLCRLSRIHCSLLNVASLNTNLEDSENLSEDAVIAESKRAGQILEQFYGHQLPKLLKRLDANRREKGRVWHAKSTDLDIFIHAVLAAGPGLLLGLESRACACGAKAEISIIAENCVDIKDSALLLTLRLLEEACRLGEPLGSNKVSGDSETNPLAIAAEAELHLRGLLLLVRLTEHARVRIILAQPSLFGYCLEKLVLPSCLWRAGRTAEAMRKAAATSLVALLAAVVPLSPPTSTEGVTLLEGVTPREALLDQWLEERIEPTRGKLEELRNKHALLSSRIRLIDCPEKLSPSFENASHQTNLGLISSASPRLLAQLLARLGGLLTDDVEATRLLACTGLTLLFGGLFSGGSVNSVDGVGSSASGTFLHSPEWFLPLLSDDSTGREEIDSVRYGDKMPDLTAPLPNSLGDKVYRFYPSLLKALDDASDDVRLRAADVFVTWFWVMSPNLIDRSSCGSTTQAAQLNSTYTAVMEDLTSVVAVHLDDNEGVIRAATARVVLRIAQIAPEIVRRVLTGARERHRSPQLCEALISALDWRLEDGRA